MARILVIDDRSIHRATLVSLLKIAKHQIFTSDSIQESIKIAKSVQPDLIISDIYTPKLNIYNLITHLQFDTGLNTIPILIYTETQQNKDLKYLKKITNIKAITHHKNPPHKILNTINKILGEKIEKPTTTTKKHHTEKLKLSKILNNFANSSKFIKKYIDLLLKLTTLKIDLSNINKKNNSLSYLAKKLSELSNSKYAIILLLNNKHEIDSASSHGISSIKLKYISINKKSIYKILTLNKPANTQNIEYFISNYDKLNFTEKNNALINPIKTTKELYGIVLLSHKKNNQQFNEFDKNITILISNYISSLYEHNIYTDSLQSHLANLGENFLCNKIALEEAKKIEKIFYQFNENIDSIFYMASKNLDRIIYVGPAFEKIWGHSRDKLYKNPYLWSESILQEDQDKVHDAFFNKLVSHATSVSIEYRIKRPDGSVRYIYDRGFQVKDSSGNVFSVVGMATDMTDLYRDRQISKAQSDIYELLTKSSDTSEAVKGLLKIIGETFDFDFGDVFLLNEEKHYLYCIDLWHKNLPNIQAFSEKTRSLVLYKDNDFTSNVLKNNSTTWIANYSSHKSFQRASLAKKSNIKSALGLLLSFGGKKIGTISFFRTSHNKPDNETVQIIEKLAKQLSKFIHYRLTENQIAFITDHDRLTGFLNRAAFENQLTKTIADEKNQLFAVITIDIDRFRLINEIMGSEGGDLLLKTLADKFRALYHDQASSLGRVGTDQIAFIQNDVHKINDIIAFVEHILKSLKEPFYIKNEEIFISVSIGISVYPYDGQDSKTLLKHADTALNKIKERGGNYYQFFAKELSKSLSEKKKIENALYHALNKNQFELYYQPKVDLRTREMIGVEALLRWKDPKKHALYPTGSLL